MHFYISKIFLGFYYNFVKSNSDSSWLVLFVREFIDFTEINTDYLTDFKSYENLKFYFNN